MSDLLNQEGVCRAAPGLALVYQKLDLVAPLVAEPLLANSTNAVSAQYQYQCTDTDTEHLLNKAKAISANFNLFQPISA